MKLHLPYTPGEHRRRPHLQGRFSGRLTTKEDERRLAEECKLLGPLLGGVGKRGDKSRLTLAKIVRGVATGDVRRFCEERERAIAVRTYVWEREGGTGGCAAGACVLRVMLHVRLWARG